jgi:CTP:molybdopterin cytidylyltransferase MocA
MIAGGPIACAVLAAGASRRLGQAKQIVRVRGRPLVRAIAEAACASACGRVAVVLGARAELVRPALAGLPVSVLINAGWDEGMASSVRLAARWAVRHAARALVLATVDQVHLQRAHLDRLIAASDGGRRAVASAYGGVRGVPAVVPAALFDQLVRLSGDEGARALLRAAPDLIALDWAEGAFDLDSGEDLRRAAPEPQ